MDPNGRPRVAEGIEISEVADGYVVYDPKKDRVHYLNQTAVLILELCTGEVSAGELPSLVQAAYDLSEPPEREVAECLRTLVEEGLVR